MLNENAKKWVAALRSGQYRQAKHRLNIKGIGLCCLGVACELYLEAGNTLDISTSPDKTHARTLVSYDGKTGCLPPRVQAWLGIPTPLAAYREPTSEPKYPISHALAYDNDGGKTFAEIADIIESEPAGLFAPTTPNVG